jgi:SsrA-binding protein
MKQPPKPRAVLNRRARYDFEVGDELRVGIALTGPEVRAARDSHVQLRGAFVTVRNNELWLNNASFSVVLNTKGATNERAVDTSPRKLLAHRREIDQLMEHKKAGLTIVPLRLIPQGRHIKVIIAAAKGKKNYDKRQTIKRREQEREARGAIKRHL